MKRLVAVVIAVVAMGLVPAALASGTLSGRYKTRIAADPALHGGLNGTWVLRFTPRHVTASHDGKVVDRVRDRIRGDKITIFGGSGSCGKTGKYMFKLTGAKLRFTAVSDPCLPRRDVLTHGPFHKV
ncbi:MAG: hypothetical protein JO321_13180 [Solirubrobacterales bacterium]|nr:hypothetical protein [Solirubrobacterales bacterium]MBV9536356.1 hypothetical protein [Solirubrobacterales bacterium]